MKFFHNLNFQGMQAMFMGLHRQPTAQAPIVRGEIALDDATGALRYSPDGATWVYPAGGDNGISVGAPHVEISGFGSDYTISQDGTAMGVMRGRAMLFVRDVPDAFYNDPKLDAGIDLYMRRPKNHDAGRLGQSQRKRHRWTHPVSVVGGQTEDMIRIANGVIPRPSKYRGAMSPSLPGDRQTFWPLLGHTDGDEVCKDVNFAMFFNKTHVEVYEAPFTPSSVQFSNTSFGPAGTNRSLLNKINGPWFYRTHGTEGCCAEFAFAYSWRDLNSVDPRARIIGPMSRAIFVSAYPWPVVFDYATGKRKAQGSKGLAVRFAR